MVYPREALVSFEASDDLCFDYRFAHLHMALRALKDSQVTQLSLDRQGTLEIKMRFSPPTQSAAQVAQAAQHGMAPKPTELFAHFFLFPLVDDDDADDPTAAGATYDPML